MHQKTNKATNGRCADFIITIRKDAKNFFKTAVAVITLTVTTVSIKVTLQDCVKNSLVAHMKN